MVTWHGKRGVTMLGYKGFYMHMTSTDMDIHAYGKYAQHGGHMSTDI